MAATRFPPTPFGWFYDYKPKGESLRILKLVPAYIRGIGCFVRHALFGFEEYKEYDDDLSFRLAGWHNALIEVVKEELEVKDVE